MQSGRKQRSRRSLAASDQKIAAAGVGKTAVRRITTDWNKFGRMPHLPCPTQTGAPWTFTCEPEAITVVRARSRLVIAWLNRPFPLRHPESSQSRRIWRVLSQFPSQVRVCSAPNASPAQHDASHEWDS
jgi:hypothetical protein